MKPRPTHTTPPDSEKRMVCYFHNRRTPQGRSIFCLTGNPIWVCETCISIILQLTIDEYGNVKIRTKKTGEDKPPAP